MRISIDVDLDASEVPAATELLSVLRSLTEHIRVKQRGADAAVPNGHAYPPQQVRSPQAAAQSAAPPVAPVAQQAQPQPDPERQTALANYIRTATTNFGDVVRNLEKALKSEDPQVDQLFYNAFGSVVLDPKYINADDALHQEHMQYISLLGELQESIRARIGQGLVALLVRKLLEQKHENRPALLIPAMVYAQLVQLNMANVKGTIKMVEKCLTSKAEAVGVTLLGKTAELCIDKVLQHASPAHLKSLTTTLDQLDKQYDYDVNYLNSFIHWKDPCFRILTTRQAGHVSAITAMAFDPRDKQLISASRDGIVNIWDEWGNIICRHSLPGSYAYALAVRPEQRDVILIAQPVPNTKNSGVCIAAIGLDPPHQLKGPYARSRAGIVTCLAVLPGHETFAVGEQIKEGPSGGRDVICVYDGNMLNTPPCEAQPIVTMVSQAGQITCLCAYGQSKQVVLAGTRHGQVALWALTKPEKPVKIFDMPSDAGIPICLDYDQHNTFLCGTSSKTVVQWNMSQMAATGQADVLPFERTFPVDEWAILKVLFWPNKEYGSQAAIITVHGCWIADLSGPADQKPNLQHVQDVPGDDCSFNCGAWAGNYPYLYAGGGSKKVHVCQFVPDPQKLSAQAPPQQ